MLAALTVGVLRTAVRLATLAPFGNANIVNSRGNFERTTQDLFIVEGPAIPKSRRFDATVLEGIVVPTLHSVRE